MKVAVFPGSFDPLTLGHLDLIKRGSALFDQLAVAVMTNESKNPLFTVEERVAQIKEAVSGLDNVSVITTEGLTVDLMNRIGADYLMRGLRNTTDFQYERDIAALNQTQDADLETVLLLAKQEFAFISSSMVKEIATFGGQVEQLVPPVVASALAQKLGPESD